MSICPICNGLEMVLITCSSCLGRMEDCGRVVDYHDKYSPYLDEEITNLVDGNESTNQNCIHLYYCGHCNEEKEISIQLN